MLGSSRASGNPRNAGCSGGGTSECTCFHRVPPVIPAWGERRTGKARRGLYLDSLLGSQVINTWVLSGVTDRFCLQYLKKIKRFHIQIGISSFFWEIRSCNIGPNCGLAAIGYSRAVATPPNGTLFLTPHTTCVAPEASEWALFYCGPA